jgi:pseudouridine synthase
LLSNDGEFNYQFTHPKFQKEKEYILMFGDPINADLISGFENGIELTEGLAKADSVRQLSDTSLQVTVHQGWKRQLRRMAAHYNYKIHRLIRTRIGHFTVDGLNPGEWKEISGRQINR